MTQKTIASFIPFRTVWLMPNYVQCCRPMPSDGRSARLSRDEWNMPRERLIDRSCDWLSGTLPKGLDMFLLTRLISCRLILLDPDYTSLCRTRTPSYCRIFAHISELSCVTGHLSNHSTIFWNCNNPKCVLWSFLYLKVVYLEIWQFFLGRFVLIVPYRTLAVNCQPFAALFFPICLIPHTVVFDSTTSFTRSIPSETHSFRKKF